MFYRSKGIQLVRSPIDDTDENLLVRGLIESATQLNYLVNEKQQRVYVHCTSAITRGPSVALVYFSLFIKHHEWQNPQRVADFIRNHHKVSFPNMTAALRTIRENKHI